MKKNRIRIKYVGAVAAALLAAAPIAATAVSAVSAPAFAATTAKADAQPSRDELADAVKQGQELIGKLDNDITAAQKAKDDATKAGSDAQAAIPAAEQDLADKKDALGQAAADQVSTVAEQQPIIAAAKQKIQTAQGLIDAKKPAVDAAQTALNAAKADTATADKAVEDAYAAVKSINDQITANKTAQGKLDQQYSDVITERYSHPKDSQEWKDLDAQSKVIKGQTKEEIKKQEELTAKLDPANTAGFKIEVQHRLS